VETIAEVFFHGAKELPPGGSALANLKLQDEVLVLPGDRFIVRQFSPVVTIGGGAVLDPLARRPMLWDTGRVKFLETLERGSSEEILSAMTERALLGLGYEEIVARAGWTEKEVHGALEKLHGTGRVRTVAAEPLVLVSGKLFEEVRKKITERVERFQKDNPLLPGIAREDLRASLGKRVRSETFRAALEELAAQKKLDAQGDLVKKAGSEIALLPEEAKAKEQIEAAFASSGLAVPSVKEVLAKLTVEAKRAEKLLQILLREKNLVRVSPELVFHRQALAQLKEQLSAFKKAKGDRLSVPAFKELTGITRKYAIPLLEYLDRERVTRRVGEERVIL
jgi:selenocysteine-specific elongation factor